MAEAAGLVLAVIPLIPLAYQSYKICLELLDDLKYHSAGLRNCAARFEIQSTLFEAECKHILRDLVGEEDALKMFEDMDHPQWNSSNFVDCLVDSVGGAQRVALVITNDTLTQIKGVLERIARGFHEDISKLTESNTQSRKWKSIPIRVNWALLHKTDVNKALGVLREQNQDLLALRTQRFRLRNAPVTTKPRQNRYGEHVAHTTNSNLEIEAVRNFSRRLYESIRPAVCTCHQLNLRLSTSREAVTETRAKFRLVMTPDPATSNASCTCLLITTEMQIGDTSNETAAQSSVSSGPSHCSRAEPVVKRFKFSHRPAKTESGPSGRETSDSFSPTIFVKLCALLQMSPQSSGPANDPVYLGLLRSERAYKHLVYREQYSYPASYQMSLSQILCHTDRNLLIPRQERIRIAFLLAAAVLQYGSFSTSWFHENWRSHDILFFFDRQKKLQNELCSTDPHLIAPFSDAMPSDGMPIRSGRKCTRNNQLFSLAVVLTEIAFGELLKNIRDHKKIDGSGMVWEELKINEIVESKMLMREIGPKYAKVVGKCMKGDFGDGDLDKKEVQEAFHMNVLKPLEECLSLFDDE